MPKVKTYKLKPTKLIPNSHLPLLHYAGAFDADNIDAGEVYDKFEQNGWNTQWIYRYGQSQPSHYHSTTHECMAVLSGQAVIRFGVADISSDLDGNTRGSRYEDGGVEVHVTAGDVFVVPAGVAHKTHDTLPIAEFSLLTPGQGDQIKSADPRAAVASTQLSGFTMLGAYPVGSTWDFQTGAMDGYRGLSPPPSSSSSAAAASTTIWSQIWGIPKPDRDPVFGKGVEGLCGLWQAAQT